VMRPNSARPGAFAPLDLDHVVAITTEPHDDLPLLFFLNVEVGRQVVVRVEPDVASGNLEAVDLAHRLSLAERTFFTKRKKCPTSSRGPSNVQQVQLHTERCSRGAPGATS
jgi:hypothetical protein